MLHGVVSPNYSLLPSSKRKSLDEAECPVTTEEKVDEDAWEGSRAVKHAMRLMTLPFFSHLRALLASNSHYALENDEPMECNAVKELQFTSPVLSYLFASFPHEVSQPLQLERTAVQRPPFLELDDKCNTTRPSETIAEVGLSLEDHRPLVYKAEVPRIFSVHSAPAKMRRPHSSLKMTGRHSRNVTRINPDGESFMGRV